MWVTERIWRRSSGGRVVSFLLLLYTPQCHPTRVRHETSVEGVGEDFCRQRQDLK